MSIHYENDDLNVCDGCCEAKLTANGPDDTQFCQDCLDQPWDDMDVHPLSYTRRMGELPREVLTGPELPDNIGHSDWIETAPGESLIETVTAARQPGPFTLGWAVCLGWFLITVVIGLWGWSQM